MTAPLRRVTAPLPGGARVAPPPVGITQETGHGLSSNWWVFLDDDPTPELQWPHSVLIYDRMRRQDAQVKSVLRAVTLPIRAAKWRLAPNGARDEVVERTARNLGLPIQGVADEAPAAKRTRDRFSWSEHVNWALYNLVFGHMFFEQVYRVADDGLYDLRKLAPRWPKTIERIFVAPDGGLVSLQQRGVGAIQTTPLGALTPTPGSSQAMPVDIPVDRLVAYVNDREGGNWFGQSLLRGAYKHWLLKDQALRTWAQTIERNGMGVPIYTASEEEADLTAGQAIAQRHRSGSTSGAAIPAGALLDLKGVTGTLPDIESMVRYQDEAIAASVLAHFLNLGQQTGTGSYALGSTFASFFVLSLQAVAQDLASIGTAHIIEDLIDVNYGIDENAPKLVFDPIGQDPAAVVAAVQMLIAAGAIFPDPALDAFVRQLTGLPPKAPLPNATTPVGAGGPPAGTPGAMPSGAMPGTTPPSGA